MKLAIGSDHAGLALKEVRLLTRILVLTQATVATIPALRKKSARRFWAARPTEAS
jgi:ribose 5-phosphate isomerase RpiB